MQVGRGLSTKVWFESLQFAMTAADWITWTRKCNGSVEEMSTQGNQQVNGSVAAEEEEKELRGQPEDEAEKEELQVR